MITLHSDPPRSTDRRQSISQSITSALQYLRLWKRCSGGVSPPRPINSAHLPKLKTNPVISWTISCIVWPKSRPWTTHIHTICSQHEHPQPLPSGSCRTPEKEGHCSVPLSLVPHATITTPWNAKSILGFSLDDAPNFRTPLQIAMHVSDRGDCCGRCKCMMLMMMIGKSRVHDLTLNLIEVW
jgi:hypothetical protein